MLADKCQKELQVKRAQLSEKEEKCWTATKKQIQEAINCGVWTRDSVAQELEGKSVSRQKGALHVQISLLTKVIGVKCKQKIFISKANVQELKKHVLQLLLQPLSSEQQLRLDVLQNPAGLVGGAASHTWTTDGCPSVYEVSVPRYLPDNDHFELTSDEDLFLTTADLLTDLLHGDFVLH